MLQLSHARKWLKSKKRTIGILFSLLVAVSLLIALDMKLNRIREASHWHIFLVADSESVGHKTLPLTPMYGEYTKEPVHSLEECMQVGLNYVEKTYRERGCPDCFHEAGYYCARNCWWSGEDDGGLVGGGVLTDYKCEEVHPGRSASFTKTKRK